MVFHNGDLRKIRYRGREVLQRVYVAVRDRDWGTVANAISDLEIQEHDDSFEIRYTAENRDQDVHFRWKAVISGSSSGEIAWSMDGIALSSFQKNRIGFCVLHPASECASRGCSVETTQGGIVHGEFPRFVSPHQPFRDIRAITHEIEPGVSAEVRFSGDVFEMEDQRNWTDASFKTYSTPLELPFPALIERGTEVKQTVRLTLKSASGSIVEPASPLRIELLTATVPLPPIGLAGAGAIEFDQDYIRELGRLQLGHLRVDLRLGNVEETLKKAARNARALGVGLECAVPAELAEIAAACARIRPPVLRWLLCGNSVDAARQILGPVSPDAQFALGSDANFTELNRNRPDPDSCDALWFALNPQVHAFDDLSLTENLAGQSSVVESAHQFAGGKPVFVSPVTLKPRGHDPRQRNWFGAAWTLGSVKHLAESGAAGISYFEAVGVMGTPAFELLASVGEFAGGEVILSQSSDPLAVEALVLRKGARALMLLANFTDSAQQVHLPDRIVEVRPAGVTALEPS